MWLSLKKANDEIDRLKAELATRESTITGLTTELTQAKEALVTVKAEFAESSAAADALVKSLEKANAIEADLRQQLTAAQAQAQVNAQEVDQLASRKAAEITAAQGIPQIAIKPVGTNPASQRSPAASNLTGLQRAIAANHAQHQIA
jgi:chromosome segregation ATPase